MITYVNYDNLFHTALAFRAQFELRHRCFLDRQTYDVSSFNGKEYDQYDTPATTYLVHLASNGTALGSSRLSPISHGCMLTDLWPDMVEKKDDLEGSNIWEATRFCVEKSLHPDLRRQVARELVIAYLEFGLFAGVSQIIGVMPVSILRTVFARNGVRYRPLGLPQTVDGMKVQACMMDVTKDQLVNVRLASHIHQPVIANLYDWGAASSLLGVQQTYAGAWGTGAASILHAPL